MRYQQSAAQRLPTPVSPALRNGLIATTVLLVLQIALGGWVSTNYAVLACTQFPTCQDSWWPAMNFAQGFEIWRHLGVTGEGQPLDFPRSTAIHYAHRLMAYAVFVALGVLAWRLRRIETSARRRDGSRAWRCFSWPRALATCCSAGRWPRPCFIPAAPQRWPWCSPGPCARAGATWRRQTARASDNAPGHNNNQRKAAA